MDPKNWDRFSDGEGGAIAALGSLGKAGEPVVVFLRARINDPASPHRVATIEALGELGDDAQSAVADLRRLSLDPGSSAIRRAAGRALMDVDEASFLNTLPDLRAVDPALADELQQINLLRKL